jgi:hypothetical protein
MAAYCREVRKLEDKFDGLKLNHIPRWLNEATDELAKMASGRESVPTGIFASDQHKPLIHYEAPEQASNEPPTSSSGARASNKSLASGSGADLPVAPPDPEVMEMNEDPSAGSDPLPDWRVSYLDFLVQETLPVDKTEVQWPLALRTKSYVIIQG